MVISGRKETGYSLLRSSEDVIAKRGLVKKKTKNTIKERPTEKTKKKKKNTTTQTKKKKEKKDNWFFGLGKNPNQPPKKHSHVCHFHYGSKGNFTDNKNARLTATSKRKPVTRGKKKRSRNSSRANSREDRDLRNRPNKTAYPES